MGSSTTLIKHRVLYHYTTRTCDSEALFPATYARQEAYLGRRSDTERRVRRRIALMPLSSSLPQQSNTATVLRQCASQRRVAISARLSVSADLDTKNLK
jgi:hypothetical protein